MLVPAPDIHNSAHRSDKSTGQRLRSAPFTEEVTDVFPPILAAYRLTSSQRPHPNTNMCILIMTSIKQMKIGFGD